MSLLLCHECFSWVEPYGERCPECWLPIDVAVPDPSLQDLGMALGEVERCLGEVVTRRPRLPQVGMLYSTSNGLFFVPHRAETVTTQVPVPDAGQSLFWTLASFIWSPLALISPLVHGDSGKKKDIPVYRPHFLTSIDSPRLPQILMENPGVFFVPRESIRQITRKRNRWLIDRRHGTRVAFKPQSERRRFHEKMAELTATEPWTTCGAML